MKVKPENTAAAVEHAGRTWYFCAQGCKAKFEADPGKYDGSGPAPLISIAAAPKTTASAQYTCPMHPEVLSPKPGACPKCGMALDPTQPTPPPEHIEYTCPMHPQIVRDGPAPCPICVMALEPRSATVTMANPELITIPRPLCLGPR